MYDDYPHPTSPGVTASMKANRPTDTQPELVIRSALHARGFRFRKDYLVRCGGARTKVDIAFTRQRVAVFIDGCFWHGCPDHGTTPKANSHYWTPKLKRNRDRDRRITAALGADDWKVVRLWEHVPVGEAVELIAEAVGEAVPPGRSIASRQGRSKAARSQ